MGKSKVILFTYLVLHVKIHISDVGRMKDFFFVKSKKPYMMHVKTEEI
jgi:hypothetical protein